MRGEPLHDAADKARLDAAAIAAGTDIATLMRAAGAAVAHAAQARLPASGARRIAVFAGPGNNGGDAAVAATELAAAGHEVTLLRLGQPPTDGPAAAALQAWHGATIQLDDGVDASAALQGADLLIDGLLGGGLSRPVAGAFEHAIRAMNAHPAPTLAIDVPSGLDATRAVIDGPVVEAAATITFERLAPAHLLLPGRHVCGELLVASIGMPSAAFDAVPTRCVINRPDAWRSALSVPAADAHKYRRGHVLVRGGPMTAGGAARLSATTALGCGAGAVTLGCVDDALAVNACHLNAVMLVALNGVDDLHRLLQDERLNVLLLGPGNGSDAATRALVEAALASGRDAVLDADALTSHGNEREALIGQLQRARGQIALTPHDGEFARLFGDRVPSDRGSRLHRARAAAAACGCVVVSKGPDTTVAAPDGRAAIACNAPPWLATAGAGDVLAGAIASLLAQGAPAFEAAAAAVWLHGEAARALGYPLTAERLVPAIAEALRDVMNVPPPPIPAGPS